MNKKQIYTIYYEEVPCTEFIGTEGLTKEKKKEKWLKIKCDVPVIQEYINRTIHYKGSIINIIYNKFIKNKNLKCVYLLK